MQVIVNSAMTVDGKIATHQGDSAISSKDDLIRVHKLRDSVDGIIVGISTVLADNPRLTIRLGRKQPKEKHLTRIIIDSMGRIPLDSQILRTASKIKTIVAVTKLAHMNVRRKIKKTGAVVIVAGTNTVDLKRVLWTIQKMGIKKILVEGGGEINWSLFSLGIVNELIVTIAPKIVGGRQATTLVEGEGYSRISQGLKLQLKKVRMQNGGELVLHYKL
ncbi:MAG TPA: 2,5-diamino-6-(ribosylamino)-4(3H)-pyrimidinone 5'-phosphate reductase [Nitrososphaeraceae archaeon]|nr:2,5-diamino-6-(ribosylamino)-4(3H)-pyrimidinone 5'-phosphate reductase [Nitrososphaeraceae archaeon]